MKVVALPEVRLYLRELVHILYEQNYFGFEVNAIKYVSELFYEIETTLPQRHKKTAPSYFDRYGKNMYYASFRKNKNTEWYVFFTIYQNKGQKTYLVRYISNNHQIAHLL